jgi:hypothetical protein
MRWIRFFIGTPARFVVTALAVLGLVGVEGFYPGEMSSAVGRFVYGTILPIGLFFAIMGVGFALMAKAFRIGGKKKK